MGSTVTAIASSLSLSDLDDTTITLDGSGKVAIKDNGVTTDKIADANVTEAKALVNLEAGTSIFYSDTGLEIVNNTSWTKWRGATLSFVPASGTVRVNFRGQEVDGAEGQAQVYINGSPVGTLRTLTGSNPDYTEDFSVNDGDTVEIWYRRTNGTGNLYMSQFWVAYDDSIGFNPSANPTGVAS